MFGEENKLRENLPAEAYFLFIKRVCIYFALFSRAVR